MPEFNVGGKASRIQEKAIFTSAPEVEKEDDMKFSARLIATICALILIATLAGCGSGGNGANSYSGNLNTTARSQDSTTTVNSYSLTEDAYGLQNATFLAATNSNGVFVMRAAIASSMTDPNFRTVFRINILQPSGIAAGNSYALGGSNPPAEILFFNGQKSTLLNTTSGTITFTSFGSNSGDAVAGSFTAVVEDHNFSAPRPSYTVRGTFSFVVNTFGAIIPSPSPVPAEASNCYNAKCASCHTLGNYDSIRKSGAPDLSRKGGMIPGYFTGYEPGHVVVNLSSEEVHDLKILMNAN